MDYDEIGFKAGLEIHQQLDTHKLFCDCPSVLTDDSDYFFERFLRPTQSEVGDVDRAALEEARRNKRFLYTASDKSTCLVEADEEPPHAANEETIDICLAVAVLLGAQPVDEIQFMRKIVIDGSNTGGFQRTALVALNGVIDNVGIKSISLEEDAARKIKEKGKLVNYGLDRLGVPLIEIATSADIQNPSHARKVAERIGLLLRATGRVKRGLGTIRQDLNVSIAKGARVEIKGIQSLGAIAKVAEQEALRQLGLIEIKETLAKRIKPRDLKNIEMVDITRLLKSCKSKKVSKQLRKGGVAKAVKLPSFSGLLKHKRRRLGGELAAYARMESGIEGILHSDELPGYGLEKNDVEKIVTALKTTDADAFVIVVGKEEMVDVALQAVVKRAQRALQGVLEEVRRALPENSTEYMRPLPGAARMYPETDIQPVRITPDRLKRIARNLPELPQEKHQRFIEEYQINEEQARQILSSGYEHDFEKLVKRYPGQKNTILRTFLNTFPELEKEDVKIQNISEKMLMDVFSALSGRVYSKEALPELLTFLAAHPDKPVGEAVRSCGLKRIDREEIEEIVKKAVSERLEFVKERGRGALGPLMGVIMKELRGRADGRLISRILREEVDRVIGR
jgi:glutamyl-tRNA(Gln) amidotransferase subunit E